MAFIVLRIVRYCNSLRHGSRFYLSTWNYNYMDVYFLRDLYVVSRDQSNWMVFENFTSNKSLNNTYISNHSSDNNKVNIANIYLMNRLHRFRKVLIESIK